LFRPELHAMDFCGLLICPALCREILGDTLTQIGTADTVPGADSDQGAKPSRVNLPSTEFFDGLFEGFRSPACF
jgi:hypothetical protein